MQTKKCCKCKEEKQLSEFPKDRSCKDGYRGSCKYCFEICRSKYLEKIKTQNKDKKINLEELSICSTCKEMKSNGKFFKDITEKSGLSSKCKTCSNIATNNYKDKNNKNFLINFEKHKDSFLHCSMCKTKKHASEFGAYKASKTGFRYTCKCCSNIKKNKSRKENPEQHRAYDYKRRVAKANGGIKSYVSASDIKHIIQLHNNCCHYCGKDVANNYTIDHKIPVFKGGDNSLDNLLLSCPHCNFSKGKKDYEQFVEELNNQFYTSINNYLHK